MIYTICKLFCSNLDNRVETFEPCRLVSSLSNLIVTLSIEACDVT
jgi:hypothetical protein